MFVQALLLHNSTSFLFFFLPSRSDMFVQALLLQFDVFSSSSFSLRYVRTSPTTTTIRRLFFFLPSRSDMFVQALLLHNSTSFFFFFLPSRSDMFVQALLPPSPPPPPPTPLPTVGYRVMVARSCAGARLFTHGEKGVFCRWELIMSERR